MVDRAPMHPTSLELNIENLLSQWFFKYFFFLSIWKIPVEVKQNENVPFHVERPVRLSLCAGPRRWIHWRVTRAPSSSPRRGIVRLCCIDGWNQRRSTCGKIPHLYKQRKNLNQSLFLLEFTYFPLSLASSINRRKSSFFSFIRFRFSRRSSSTLSRTKSSYTSFP